MFHDVNQFMEIWWIQKNMVRIQLTFSVALLLLYITFSSSAFLATSISDAVSSKLSSSTTDDEYALVSFKHNLNLDPNHVLTTSWSEKTHFCTWVGVSCNNNNTKNQRVSALDLSSMGLQGTIPTQIANLSFLSYLNLMNNSFHGPLQPQLANLTHLTYINLGANNFDEEIPSWLGYFPNLEHLHLHSSFFSGTIPHSLTNISTLKTLSLFNNNLSGDIPEDIGKLSSLETLNLYDNRKISGSIPSSLFNASFLKVLHVSNNRVSGSLPDDMCHHVPNLERLIIHHNQLDGQLPSSLSKCKQLVTISVGFNKFQGTIPQNLGNLTLLQDLDLTKNEFKGEIPEGMGSLRALERFRAYDNHLQGSIPNSLFNCSLLWELDLVLNNFTGVLPKEIGKLQNLKALTVAANQFTGAIPSAVFNTTSLENLRLHSNMFSGSLPSSLFLALPNLEELNIWGNEFTGHLPTSISNASKIILLDVSLNFFSGILPNTLSNSRHLSWLGISDTYVTDESTKELSFISSLANCTALTNLDLAGNPFGVSLPSSIGNLPTTLEYLLLGECQIKGKIPEEIGKLSSLVIFDLWSNQLSGSIPDTIGSLQELQGLALSGNQLSGSIPSSLCSLRNLVKLYLNENKLLGSLPACFGGMTSLRTLHLDSNNFSSAIPSTFWSLEDILEMNLSSNSLSGHLSPDIGNLKVIIAIDFSNNLLSGVIPTSMGGLQSLKNLSFAHNTFEGQIPESLGKMISLEALDLSNNYLSGGIPVSLQALKYLRYLNVSFNNLQGEIPTGGPFSKFSYMSFLGNDALCSMKLSEFSPCKTTATGGARISKKHLLKFILPAVLSSILIVLVSLVFLFLKWRKGSLKNKTDEEATTPVERRRISYLELQQATEKFSESNLLGAGGFGTVYKGTFPDRTDAAIKIFNLQLEGATKSFDAECDVMRNVRHRNLLKIISSCSNGLDFKAIVLEYMSNGSLEKWLHSHNYCLDMLQRLNIMIDVASGLDYLHHGFGRTIVHCDLKPSNILLDADMVAHVADFGISKLLGGEDSLTQTMTLATIGYMAPEYGSEGKVSTRGDVYSYGIMLMETFTRKKPTDDMCVGGMSLRQYVKGGLPGAIAEVADANLLAGKEHLLVKTDCISSILSLAVDCSNESFDMRIDITEVLARLENIKTRFLRCLVSNVSLVKNSDDDFVASPSSPTSRHLRSNQK